MNKWYILGIEPTKDKELIRKAYFNKLNTVHPEENPEGFRELREAFEALMREADEEECEDNSEIGLWMNDINRIYNNFALRIDVEAWRELFNEDICFSIDTREEAMNSLLKFLMDNFYIPRDIWCLINDIFDIKDKGDDLCNEYPSEFIDFVISKIDYDSIINYKLFKVGDGKEYDKWIYLYNQARRKVFNSDIDDAIEMIKEIESLNIYHPYLEALKARIMLLNNKIDEAKEALENLIKKYPNEVEIISVMAEYKWIEEDYEEALKYYEMEISIEPNHFDALSGKADCYQLLGKLDEAKDIYVNLIRRNSYDDYVRQKIFETNDLLANKYREELKEDSNNNKIKFSLAWVLYENCNYTESKEVSNGIKLEENSDDLGQYYDLLGKLHLANKNFEEAYDTYKKWQECLKDNAEDRDTLLSYIYSQEARALNYLDKKEEAIEYYNKTMEISGEKPYYLNSIASILNKLNRYEESIKVSDKSLEIDSYQAEAYINRAESFYGIEYDRDALDDCFKAEGIYPYFVKIYVLEAKIYNKYKEYDDVLEIVKKAEGAELYDNKLTLYKIKALIGKDNYDDAQKECINVLEKIEKGEISDKEFIADIYYEKGIILNDTGSFNGALTFIDKAIKENPKYYDYYYFKAFIYQNLEEYDKAIKIYDDMILTDSDPIFALRCKGKIYNFLKLYDKAIESYKEINRYNPDNNFADGLIYEIYKELGQMEKALRYLNIQLEKNPSPYYFIEKGIIFADKSYFDKAKLNYEKALELEPDNKYAFNNIGCLYYDIEEYDKAIEYYEKGLEYDKELEFSDGVDCVARCLYNMKEYDKALERLDRGIEVYNSEDLYLRKIKILKELKRYKEVIDTYNYLINNKEISLSDEDKVEHYIKVGECYEYLNEYRKALEIYKEITVINEKHNEAYEKMAGIYEYLGETSNAISAIEKQISISVGDVEVLIRAGEISKGLGEKWESRKYFKKALDELSDKEEKNACTFCYLGRCYLGFNDFGKAKIYFDKAISSSKYCNTCSYGKCFEAYYNLAKIEEIKGDLEKALSLYETSIEVKGEDDVDVIRAIRKLKIKMK